MKRLIELCLSVVLLISLAGCGAPAPASDEGEKVASGIPSSDTQETVTIKLPHYFPEGDPVADTLAEYFKPQVESRTEGRVKVELYPNSVLAAEEGTYEGLRNGTYEMGVIANIFQDRIPQITVFQYPFLFDSFSQAKKAMCDDGWAFKLTEGTEEFGFMVKGAATQGFRIMSLNKKVESIDDFKGFKLRMPNYENMVKIGEALGCAVSPMAINEVFSALEQHVIDGQENPVSTIRSYGWYEVQDYIMVSNHVFTPLYICVNNDFYNALSEEDQKTLDEVILETTDLIWKNVEEQTEADLDFMANEGGVEVYYPSDELRQQMIEATSSVYEELLAENPNAKAFVMEVLGE